MKYRPVITHIMTIVIPTVGKKQEKLQQFGKLILQKNYSDIDQTSQLRYSYYVIYDVLLIELVFPDSIQAHVSSISRFCVLYVHILREQTER